MRVPRPNLFLVRAGVVDVDLAIATALAWLLLIFVLSVIDLGTYAAAAYVCSIQ